MHVSDFELHPPAGLAVERPAAGAEGGVLLSFPLESAALVTTPLSPAEEAIVMLLRRGLTRREIASLRTVSERTVANQIASVFQKLGVHSRLDLMLQVRGSACASFPRARTHDE